MGRTSDYTKQVRNEEYENIAETTKKSAKSFADIKRMFAKEPMTAEQFGIYLGGCKAAGDFISDKTIKRYIEKLCKMSDGKITTSNFMKTVDGTDVYIIQPEIQELLVAIFDTDFFGAKGKPKAGIDVKQRLRAQLAENVEIYLDEDVKKQVKSAPQFLNARLEDILTEKINNEVRGMFATMQDSDDTIQYQLMLETLDRLVAIRRWMNEWNARINLIKQEFAKTEYCSPTIASLMWISEEERKISLKMYIDNDNIWVQIVLWGMILANICMLEEVFEDEMKIDSGLSVEM